MTSERIVSLLELTAITACYFCVVWFIGPQVQAAGLHLPMIAMMVLGLAYVVFLSPMAVHKDSPAVRGIGSWRTCFLRTDNLRQALPRFAILTFVGASALVATALIRNPRVFAELRWDAFFLKFGFYFVSALGQDLLFLCFIYVRLQDVLRPSETDIPAVAKAGMERRTRLTLSILASTIFATYHLPNPPLMIVTFIVGGAFTWVYYAYPNLLVAVCCHAVLGTLLHRVVGLYMRIGVSYRDPDCYLFRTLFPFLRVWIADRF